MKSYSFLIVISMVLVTCWLLITSYNSCMNQLRYIKKNYNVIIQIYIFIEFFLLLSFQFFGNPNNYFTVMKAQKVKTWKQRLWWISCMIFLLKKISPSNHWKFIHGQINMMHANPNEILLRSRWSSSMIYGWEILGALSSSPTLYFVQKPDALEAMPLSLYQKTFAL